MTVVYAAAAVDEVAEILVGLATDSPNAAERLQARLRQVERQIEAHPSSGRAASARGIPVRRIVLRPYRYVLFYRVESDGIVVVGIRHGARDPSSMPDADETSPPGDLP